MNIGQASRAAALPVKTIRYYEGIGLIKAQRAGNGYRDFTFQDVERLKFLSRARNLGFPLEECRRLLELQSNERRASKDVRSLAARHLLEVRKKIVQLQDLEAELQELISQCRGDNDPDCAILQDLTTRAIRPSSGPRP